MILAVSGRGASPARASPRGSGGLPATSPALASRSYSTGSAPSCKCCEEGLAGLHEGLGATLLRSPAQLRGRGPVDREREPGPRELVLTHVRTGCPVAQMHPGSPLTKAQGPFISKELADTQLSLLLGQNPWLVRSAQARGWFSPVSGAACPSIGA